MKKYYKVVSKDMWSARTCWSIDDVHLSIRYKLNEWVYPKIKYTDLMVFEFIEDAQFFKGFYERIFECEVKNPRKQGNLIYDNTIPLEETVSQIIKNRQQKKKWTHLVAGQKRPPGTVFCSAVKLTKEIT